MLQPGHIINDTYRVEKLLGSGGMADVYVVTHLRMPRKFALKVMRLDQGSRDSFLERFNREGEILATIRHPHIVDVIDRNQLPDGNPYLVMEYLEGEDLSTFLARTGPLSVPVALRICSQIGEALQAAHQVGVVHRDLKPSNVFLSKEGQVLNFVKVLDFGIAKFTTPEKTPMTAPAALMGTPAYMSPEQAMGLVEKIDERTDQFALGAVLYEMLTGAPAFHRPGDTVYAILEKVVHHQPEPFRDAPLNRALMRALSKKPEQRFSTMREFLAAVGATTHTVYSPTSINPPPPGTVSSQMGERTLPPRRRFKRVVTALGVGVALCAASIGIYHGITKHPQPPISASATAASSQLPLPTVQVPPMAVAPGVKPTPSTSPEGVAAVNLPPTAPTTPNGVPSAQSAPPKAVAGTVSTAGRGDTRPPGTKTPARPPYSPTGFVISSKAKFEFLNSVVLTCARGNLASLGLRDGTIINLERSGTLTVVEGPPAVLASGFNACLRQMLLHVTHDMIPSSVTIKVVR